MFLITSQASKKRSNQCVFPPAGAGLACNPLYGSQCTIFQRTTTDQLPVRVEGLQLQPSLRRHLRFHVGLIRVVGLIEPCTTDTHYTLQFLPMDL